MKGHIKLLIIIRKSGLNAEFCKMHADTAGLAVIKNRKLSQAFSNNKQCLPLPGGKVENRKTAAMVLSREINKELNILLEETDKAHEGILAPGKVQADN